MLEMHDFASEQLPMQGYSNTTTISRLSLPCSLYEPLECVQDEWGFIQINWQLSAFCVDINFTIDMTLVGWVNFCRCLNTRPIMRG